LKRAVASTTMSGCAARERRLGIAIAIEGERFPSRGPAQPRAEGLGFVTRTPGDEQRQPRVAGEELRQPPAEGPVTAEDEGRAYRSCEKAVRVAMIGHVAGGTPPEHAQPVARQDGVQPVAPRRRQPAKVATSDHGRPKSSAIRMQASDLNVATPSAIRMLSRSPAGRGRNGHRARAERRLRRQRR